MKELFDMLNNGESVTVEKINENCKITLTNRRDDEQTLRLSVMCDGNLQLEYVNPMLNEMRMKMDKSMSELGNAGRNKFHIDRDTVTLNELLPLLRGKKVAICDLTVFNEFENKMSEILLENGILFATEDRLETMEVYHHLSKYEVIIFFTTGTRSKKVRECFDFNKDNLQLVVAMGEEAFSISNPLCSYLDIKLVQFNPFAHIAYEERKNENSGSS